MEKFDLSAYLSGNEYPGRGICIGVTPDGKQALIGYFIMGRSANSRNRVFAPIEGGIETRAADPAKLEDPHLIIYNPVLTLGDEHIVTNGDQTNTIYEAIQQGGSFESGLRTRTFEDDGPNWTPRISGIVNAHSGAYKLSILKSNDGNGDSVLRQTFDYPQPVAGEGHFLSTYKSNGNPLPSFAGEPIRVPVDESDPNEWAGKLWEALNEENKVSLFVRAIDLASGDYEDVILNKYTAVPGKKKKK